MTDINTGMSQTPAVIRVMKCKECKAYKRERSADGNFKKFVCKCGSTSGMVISITAGV